MRSRICAVAMTVLAASLLVTANTATGRDLHTGGQSLAAATTDPPNTLYAGQKLVARTTNAGLRSQSGEFSLSVASGYIELDQTVRITGPRGDDWLQTGVWHREDTFGPPVAERDHTVLQLKRNGNLVLVTQRGRLLWTTHTKGSGAHNRLVVRNNGNLVMYNGAGKRVWASWTTPAILGAGESLQSGQHLVDRWDSSFIGYKVVTITMQRSGNLVYRCRQTVNWSTHTHVPGSHVDMQDNGNVVLRAPDGRRLWSTHTKGVPYDYFTGAAVFSLRGAFLRWSAKLPDPLHC